MKNIIFDMDGTILDSMPAWENLGRDYLASVGVKAEDNLEEVIYNMTLSEAAEYFHSELGVAKESEQILKEVVAMIERKYFETIPAKKGMCERIIHAKESGCRICMLTTSDYVCADKAMKRLHIRDCFEQIFTSDRLGMSKRDEKIYLEVCKKMKFEPEKTVVYEDVLYAVESAKKAGCYVIAVYDEASKEDWMRIKQVADEVIA